TPVRETPTTHFGELAAIVRGLRGFGIVRGLRSFRVVWRFGTLGAGGAARPSRSATIDKNHGALNRHPCRSDGDETAGPGKGELHAGLNHNVHAALNADVLPRL